MNVRQKWLAIALVGTLAAVFWTAPEEPSDSIVEPAARKPDAKRVKLGQALPAIEKPARPTSGERVPAGRANLFPKQTWVPPPPPPRRVVPPPPPPPSPPPLPFKYLGRWVDGGKETVFLLRGDRSEPVKVGQVLSGIWRVDEITHTRVVFTYLPLDMQTTMGITP